MLPGVFLTCEIHARADTEKWENMFILFWGLVKPTLCSENGRGCFGTLNTIVRFLTRPCTISRSAVRCDRARLRTRAIGRRFLPNTHWLDNRHGYRCFRFSNQLDG